MKAIIAVPATAALVYRAWSHNSLTPAGIVAATLTAAAHAYHPWNLPFVLLCVFFLAGTRVTKIKKDVKTSMTLAAQGTPGGEGPRTHVQVFANSLVASILSILHARQLRQRTLAAVDTSISTNPTGSFCYDWGGDLLVVGIIANYAAVAADTFSSELGILSRSQPRLITSPTLRRVPRGTNGGVTPLGLGAGLLGSMIMVTAAMVFLPLCGPDTAGRLGGGSLAWTTRNRGLFMWGLTVWGALGSVLDSVLGGLFQRTVRDVRSGKVVEGEGGVRALVSADATAPEGSESRSQRMAGIKAAALSGEGESAVAGTDETAVDDTEEVDRGGDKYDPRDKHRRSSFGDSRPTRIVENGWNLLDNNDVNFLMALSMSLGAMAIAGWYWGVPLEKILKV